MNKNEMSGVEYVALIGIDWATTKHDVWLYDTKTGREEYQVLEHTPEALTEWIAGLRARYGGKPVAICLEQSKGALIYSLMGHDFLVLYPINPATLAKYREAFSPSRAKDDLKDAKLLMELLRLHQDKLKAWKPDDEKTRTLALLNEERRKAVNLRTKLVLRLASTLKNYFPQAMELVNGNLYSRLACDFLLKWPTLEQLKKVKPQTLRTFYYAHNYRRGDLIESCLEKVENAQALTSDKAVITASVTTVQMLAGQLRTLEKSVAEYDSQVARLFADHADSFIFKSLPGAGPALGPRLLAAFGSDRGRYETAEDIQTYSGVAPVVERSGKQLWIHWRWGCPKFLRQTFHEFAGCSIQYSQWAKAYYQLQRERGKGHHIAVRALAFKWIRVIYRCWKDRIPYDESTYLLALEKSHSEVWKKLQLQTQKI